MYLAERRVLQGKGQGSELLKLTDGQSENAKIKGQNAKLRNPAFVGMGVLIVALVGISGQIDLSDIVVARSVATWQSSCCHSCEGRNPAFFVILSATKNLFFITQPPKPDSKINPCSFTVNEYNLQRVVARRTLYEKRKRSDPPS